MALIKKIPITKGVYWVEVPEAKIFILCGCPADSVKYLMKRGLIVPTEENGITFETGPNVILLSDILIQNGEFSNMAEFPVLQMLYRQGMILPNHPNNQGFKPMLLGIEKQVKAQMQYIYRGNYGLVSVKELIEAGASREEAQEIMALKLKFAFGKIRPSEELLDSRIIKNEPVEIRNGVNVRRLQVNQFEFSYKEESTTVDLNLPEFANYESPYPLGFHNIRREYFAVLHLGEGDGWDVNRPSMSSILMYHGKIYLIDAGPNIINSLTALGIGINEIEGIFHTHSHDDHFAGLMTLIHADHRIKYYATQLVRSSVSKKLSALLSVSENNFTAYFDIKNLDFDVWNNIDGLEVKPVFSPHPVETSIFLFRTFGEEGYRSYGHFADIVSLQVLKKMIREDSTQAGISQSFFDQVKSDYLTTVDIKKLDIGGGMIHGSAEDFAEDDSEKIILAHTALPLTGRQKEIGSGAPFGTLDTLIPSYRDYGWQAAYKFLKTNFPETPDHQLQILLNSQVIEFNPHTILLKEGENHQEIFLTLTGVVEGIKSSQAKGLFYAGTLIGENSGMRNLPCDQTFRSLSFVRALKIPTQLYIEFANRNQLQDAIAHLQTVRDFLRETWLFGEGISYPVQSKIAQAVQQIKIGSQEKWNYTKADSLYLVEQGCLERFNEDNTFEIITAGNFFGEEKALFNKPFLLKIRAKEPSKIYRIPGKLLKAIPIVRWKLFEAYEKRKSLVLVESKFSKAVSPAPNKLTHLFSHIRILLRR